MISKHLQRGALNGGVIALLIGALALGALLIYSAVSGYELPFWPAMAVVAVNVVAAGRLAWTVIQAKRRR
jgi:hypothetical protein